MWKKNLPLGVRGSLLALMAVTALVPGWALSTSNMSQEVAHAQEKLQSFPNEGFQASIVQLLANPEKYHKKNVQVKGFVHVQFEDSSIYLSKDDADYGITSNGFWVSFEKATIPFDGTVGPSEFDRKYVLIEGTFNVNNRGHQGGWAGSFEKISRIVELKKGQ